MATRQRADAGNEFSSGKRFDQIVVGAGFEAADAVFDGVAGRQQQDGHRTATGAQAAYNFKTIDTGQADIQHGDVECGDGFGALQGGVSGEAIAHEVNTHGLRIERAQQTVSKHGIVFKQQDMQPGV